MSTLRQSGLVALKTNDVGIIDRVVAFFRQTEPRHEIEMVRVHRGDGVLLTFTPIDTSTELDFSAFNDVSKLKHLAVELKRPLWVGTSSGEGPKKSNSARSISEAGTVVWDSKSDDVAIPTASRAELHDPFTEPLRRAEILAQASARAGYGRVGHELGFDVFRVISHDVGDALLARDKRHVGPNGAADHADWLQEPFVAPEGPDSPADHIAESDVVFIRYLRANAGPDVTRFTAAALKKLMTVRRLNDAVLSRCQRENDLVFSITGQSVRDLSRTLLSVPFLELLSLSLDISVLLYGQSVLAAGLGIPEDAERFIAARDEKLTPENLELTPVSLELSANEEMWVDVSRSDVIDSHLG